MKQKLIINIKGMKELNRLSPHFLELNCIQAIFNALTPFITLFTSSMLMDELLSGRDFRRLVFLITISISATFISHVIAMFMKKKINEKRNLFQWNKGKIFSEKTLTMDYNLLEDPKTHLINQKIKEGENSTGAGLWTIINCVSNLFKGFFSVIFSLAVVAALLASTGSGGKLGFFAFVSSPLISVLLLLIIILTTAVSAFTNNKSTKRLYTEMDKFTPMNRRYIYYLNNYLLDYKSGKDIRIYNLKPLIYNELNKMNNASSSIMKKMSSILGVYECVNSSFSALTGGLVYAFVALRALAGTVTVGSILRYTGAATQLISGLTAMFSGISQLSANTGFVEVYFDFLNLKSDRYQGTLPVEKRNDNKYTIEFKNVSFKYPGTDTYAIKNLSFKLKVGEKLAVVGINGSGKTTMIKLLVRLYDPTEGEITLNGIDIKKYDFNEYTSIFSVVFQDFKLFSFPLAQNVAASVNYDESQINNVLEKTSMLDRADEMSNGIKTPLYKDFDESGIEISGGEAQKLALARALYKNAAFIVLDEPTAALDPISEFEIYSAFDEIVDGKTAIYISHRLSSCRFCDNIIVFHDGNIIQTGSHSSLLLDKNGKYYKLWNAQAQYYENN